MLDFSDRTFKRAYDATHKWIRYYYGPASKCEHCGRTGLKYQWSNISREYKRERADWQELCASCHAKYDMTPEFRAKMREIMLARPVPLRNKPVAMYSLNGELIREFPSGVAAYKETAIHRSMISLCANGVISEAGGYVWRFIDHKLERKAK